MTKEPAPLPSSKEPMPLLSCDAAGLRWSLARRPGTPPDRARAWMVLLHRAGGDERSLAAWWPWLPPEVLVLNLRAPRPMPRGGWFWYPVHFRRRGTHVSHPEVDGALEQLREVLAALPGAVGVDPALPLVLGGFSQGGALACALGLIDAPRVAGLVLVGTRLLSRAQQRAAHASPAEGRPAFIAHGASDTTIPPAQALRMARLLGERGWHTELVLAPGGHETPEPALPRLRRWIGEQMLPGGRSHASSHDTFA